MRVLVAVALAMLAAAAPGAAAPAAPAVRVPLLKGGEIFDSRGLIGKKVLVIRFQASWCKACAAQAAWLQRVCDLYQGRGVELLAIQMDDTERDARAFLEAHRATYPGALDPSLRLANRFGVKRVPFTVVVNKRGEIAARLDATTDEARLAAAIDTALKSPARPKAPARAS